MANGGIEIHDPFAHRDHLGATPRVEDDLRKTQEFRLMVAYAKRRQREKSGRHMVREGPCPSPSPTGGGRHIVEQGPCPSPAGGETETTVTESKRKKKWKRLPRILMCIKPSKADKTPQTDLVQRVFLESAADSDKETEDVDVETDADHVAIKLTEIADDIPFVAPDVETDSPDEEVEKLIGLLLREDADRFNEQVTGLLKEALRSTLWNYAFYEKLMKTMLMRMGLFNANPEGPGPQTSRKTQVAVACEVTSRLSAVDTLPSQRLLGYGATYLQNHFSSWAKQQGGYEAAFDDDDDDDDDDVQ
ncbi:uncharacterized protein LOC144069261 [Stigmatopora argus]